MLEIYVKFHEHRIYYVKWTQVRISSSNSGNYLIWKVHIHVFHNYRKNGMNLPVFHIMINKWILLNFFNYYLTKVNNSRVSRLIFCLYKLINVFVLNILVSLWIILLNTCNVNWNEFYSFSPVKMESINSSTIRTNLFQVKAKSVQSYSKIFSI